MSGPDYFRAHEHSSNHREELSRSALCGCFYCLETFGPGEIAEWTDERDGVGTCALCPRCGIDAVIGSASGFPVNAEFLRQMHERWFGGAFIWDEESASRRPSSE